MKNAWVLVAAGAAGAALMLGTAAVLAEQGPADASVLSRGSRGWLAARRYLEERGCRVALVDHDLDAAAGAGVLVLAFPWQHVGFDDPSSGIDRHLQAGGTIVFAYSGRPFDGAESAAAEALELAWEEPRQRPPLSPFRWREYAAEEWLLAPEPSLSASLRTVRIAAFRRVPRAPEGATVIVRDPKGRPAAFVFSRRRGRVVALPADAFSNARLGQPGNADLLETLRQDLGDAWSFDEFHHGLRPPLTTAETGPQRVLLLLLLQLAFAYVLVVLAVARRFGPSWSEPVVASGSAASFLMGLGVLHHRLRHHREAARLLLARARELDPRVPLPDGAEDHGDDLLGLARRVGEAQSGGRRNA